MSKSVHLWAVGFDDTGRAAQVKDVISELGREKHDLVLLDAAVAVRHRDGSFMLNGEPIAVVNKVPARTAASFLAGLALGATPMCGAAVGALLRDFGCDNASVGISDDFVCDVAQLIKPGTSILFLLDEVGDMDATLHAIRGLGGTVLKTNVDLERAKLIQSTLAASDRQVPDEE